MREGEDPCWKQLWEYVVEVLLEVGLGLCRWRWVGGFSACRSGDVERRGEV